MSTTDSPAVAVLGGGTIGAGWAALLADAGYRVRVAVRRAETAQAVTATVRLHAPALAADADALLAGLTVTTDVAEAVTGAEVVLESISERLADKQELFAAVEQAAPAEALLLSSTSTLLPDAIGARLAQPGRVLVAHPFNPPHVIPLVEVLGGPDTEPKLVERTTEFLTALGRTPVVLRRPIAGFIANRLQTALLREAIHLVQQGVATAADIDDAITGSLGPRWAVVGPFQALHLGGGPGGIRQWFGHIGAGLAAGWSQLGTPDLDDEGIAELIAQTETAYGTDGYEQRVAARDRRQLAVLAALRDEEEETR